MAHTEARAWWADVEHLKDAYERTGEARRRADLADRGEPAPRRTVEIRGRPGPSPVAPVARPGAAQRRPPRRAVERVGTRPDRLAMWALLMGIMLILVAVGTADAAVLAP